MKMNINLKIKTAKKTRLGRMLCRLAGNQLGAVMMEYVILGVMIAAAVTLAAIYFGDNIRSSLGIMSDATRGDTTGAQQKSIEAQQKRPGQDQKAIQHQNTVAPGAKD